MCINYALNGIERPGLWVTKVSRGGTRALTFIFCYINNFGINATRRVM